MNSQSIARSLISDPDIILADEPTGNLDKKNTDAFLKLIRTLPFMENKVFIIVTHDESVERFCDQVFKLEEGQIITQDILIFYEISKKEGSRDKKCFYMILISKIWTVLKKLLHQDSDHVSVVKERKEKLRMKFIDFEDLEEIEEVITPGAGSAFCC